MTTTTDPTAAGLLRAVLDEPDRDDVRLVLADWLEERGDPRGEFIRLQCRIAALEADCLCGRCVKRRGGGQHTNGPCAVDQERDKLPDGRSRQAFLRRRERALLSPDPLGPPSDVPWRWMGTAKKVVPDGATWMDHVTFRRGFVEHVTLTTAAFLEHAAALFAAQPVTRVTLEGREPWSSAGNVYSGWWETAVQHADDGDVLPRAIMEAMADDPRRADHGIGVRFQRDRHPGSGGVILFRSRDVAVDALSAACVSHGRAAAGL